MYAYYNGQPVMLTWALRVAAQYYAQHGGDVDELHGVARRALSGAPDDIDAMDAREWLSSVVPGLEFFAQ